MESEHFLKRGFGTFLFQDEPRYSIMHAIAEEQRMEKSFQETIIPLTNTQMAI